MATRYYLDLCIAGKEDQDDHVRPGLYESIADLADGYVVGCRILEARGGTAEDQVIWFAVAKEDDGEKRDLTTTEDAALRAALEQKYPDIKIQPPGEPPDYPPGD